MKYLRKFENKDESIEEILNSDDRINLIDISNHLQKELENIKYSISNNNLELINNAKQKFYEIFSKYGFTKLSDTGNSYINDKEKFYITTDYSHNDAVIFELFGWGSPEKNKKFIIAGWGYKSKDITSIKKFIEDMENIIISFHTKKFNI